MFGVDRSETVSILAGLAATGHHAADIGVASSGTRHHAALTRPRVELGSDPCCNPTAGGADSTTTVNKSPPTPTDPTSDISPPPTWRGHSTRSCPTGRNRPTSSSGRTRSGRRTRRRCADASARSKPVAVSGRRDRTLAELQDLMSRAGYHAMLAFSTATDDRSRGAAMAAAQERSTAIGTKLIFIDSRVGGRRRPRRRDRAGRSSSRLLPSPSRQPRG